MFVLHNVGSESKLGSLGGGKSYKSWSNLVFKQYIFISINLSSCVIFCYICIKSVYALDVYISGINTYLRSFVTVIFQKSKLVSIPSHMYKFEYTLCMKYNIKYIIEFIRGIIKKKIYSIFKKC